MKISLVTGSCPPGTCGVGDYSARLADALRAFGIDVEVISEDQWGLLDVAKARNNLEKLKGDIVHIQYPTSGFAYCLGPQLFAMMRRSVVTFHEVSHSHILRKLSLYPFTARAQHLIFTSEYERRFALRWAPWIRQLSSVIPVGSNIEAYPANGVRRRAREILYFGLLMPRKGLEDVLRLATVVRERGLGMVVRIVGNHRPEHAAYVEELRQRSAKLSVIWDEGLTGEQVSQKLATALIAYLPYPDGLSERRATLKAALLNRVAVVTTRGRATPEDAEKVVKFATCPEHALEIIQALVSDETEISKLQTQAVSYVAKFSWRNIAQAHMNIYEELLRPNENRR